MNFFEIFESRETVYGAKMWIRKIILRNIQFKIHFLVKNIYFPQNDALQAIYLGKEHFLNLQIRLLSNFGGREKNYGARISKNVLTLA